MKVLELQRAIAEEGDERTGIFTSGIVSTRAGRKIALCFTGRQHAGENLADVLKQRAAELPAPIQMSDALSRNAPKSIHVLVANCIAHGRRQFVKIRPTSRNRVGMCWRPWARYTSRTDGHMSVGYRPSNGYTFTSNTAGR